MHYLDLHSPDLTQDNLARLRTLFPHCITETQDEAGRIRLSVDFDLLRQELSDDLVEGPAERYRLDWPGKRQALLTANTPTTNTLRPVIEDSVDFYNTENLYIEGDNLEVLKLLQESYLGRVKMIYIDPPYNTGNDFVYKDSYSESEQIYLRNSGLVDESNNRLEPNPETSGRYHSNWLSMMYSRLNLAKRFLRNDGAIFISIDDNESHNLRKICDEIFGEKNFVALITVIVKTEGRRYGYFAKTHENILVYSKDINELLLYELEVEGYEFQHFDESGGFNLRELRNQNTRAFNSTNRPNLRYPFYVDLNSCDEKGFMRLSVDKFVGCEEVWPIETQGLLSVWRWGKDTSRINEVKNLIARRGSDDIIRVYQKTRSSTQSPKTVWFDREIISIKGTREIQELFNGQSEFDFPKPTKLIELIVQISTTEDDLILDFFAGSSTTSHSIFKANIHDNSRRKFILIQIPELLQRLDSENSHSNVTTICEIGKERIRRAAQKIKGELEAEINKKREELEALNDGQQRIDQEDQRTTLMQEIETLEQKLRDQDFGFRVFRLDSSSMEDVYQTPQQTAQTSLHQLAANIKPDRTPEDLLAHVMLDWGLPLSLPIGDLQVEDKRVLTVAGDSLFACFDDGIDEAFARAIAPHKPLRMVFRDAGFASDDARINIEQIFRQLSPGTEVRVI